MDRPSDTQREYLREATSLYHASMPGSLAEAYLEERGLFPTSAMRKTFDTFRLGFVTEPLPGHEKYRGMLAIPYLRRSEERDEFGNRVWSTVSMRFRCLEEHKHEGHGKYNTTPGDRPRLYNTVALLRGGKDMLVCEGELDALAAQVYGFNAVAVPGATSWQKHFVEPLLGYETVYILADGDQAGSEFAKAVGATLPNSRIIPCPDGEDVNSWIITPEGFASFKEKVA